MADGKRAQSSAMVFALGDKAHVTSLSSVDIW
jgi:hypothetical protein